MALQTVKVLFADEKYNYVTDVSEQATQESINNYFVGKKFDVGMYPNENVQECIGVVFVDNTGSGEGKCGRPSSVIYGINSCEKCLDEKIKATLVKRYHRAEDGDWAVYNYALFNTVLTEEESTYFILTDTYIRPAFSGGIGQWFCHGAFVRRSRTRTLIEQFCGMDV